MIKKYKHLIREQRNVISSGIAMKMKVSDIAKMLGVDPSTVYRELHRNGGKTSGKGHWKYNSQNAQEYANDRKERIKTNGKFDTYIWKKVDKLLTEEQWSPEQISGYLKLKENISISHEAIYQHIRLDKKDGGTLYKNCRHQLKHRKRTLDAECGHVKNIPNRVSIKDRPKEADGKRPGDWEADTIVGPKNKGAILTLTERSSNYSIFYKLPEGKDAKGCAEAIVNSLLPYISSLRTLTVDNGSEFAYHELITKMLHIPVYFADPYASWQKGAIENENGLLRQYVPKGTDFDNVSDKEVHAWQIKINNRPRKKYGYKTPLEVFMEELGEAA